MSFPRYPAYKPSGVEWLGEVPEHWEVKPAKRLIGSIEQGWSPQCENYNVDGSEGWGVLKVGCVNGGVFRPTENKWLPVELDPRPELAVLKGDLLVSRANTRELVGSAAVAIQDYPNLLLCDKLYRIKVDSKEARPQFLSYFLGSREARGKIELEASGASDSMLNISQSVILELPCPVPPACEQASIATFLDHETGKIDALIAEQQRLIQLARERIKALALSGYSCSNSRQDRIGRLVEPISRPVVISGEASYEPLGLYNRGRGLFHKELRPGSQMGDSDFFYVEDGDLVLSGQFAWEGAVALATENETGCVVSHRYPVIRGNSSCCLTEFLLALLWSDHGDFLLNQCSRGAAGRNRPLNLDLLLKEQILVPDLSIQEEIKGLVWMLQGLEKECAYQRDLALERKKALISAAVTGQIDVRGLVPEADAA